MAIDLFCYTSFENSDAQLLLSRLKAENKAVFSTKFLASDSREASEIGREIASEHGFVAKSRFLIAVNDKSAIGQIKDVSSLVKQVFGKDSVIILKNNEISI